MPYQFEKVQFKTQPGCDQVLRVIARNEKTPLKKPAGVLGQSKGLRACVKLYDFNLRPVNRYFSLLRRILA
jgi:hypothetical protein